MQGAVECGRGWGKQAAVPALGHATWLVGSCTGRGPAERPRHVGLPGPAVQPHRPAAVTQPSLGGPAAGSPGRNRGSLPFPGLLPFTAILFPSFKSSPCVVSIAETQQIA